MRLVLNDREYTVQTKDSKLVSSVEELLPLSLKLSRSADHEYYTSLPEQVDVTGAESTSYVKAGWIYYFREWNAFALNFKETDIAPYKVYIIGEVIGSIEDILAGSGASVELEVKE